MSRSATVRRPVSPEGPEPRPAGGPRILVVDDEVSLRDMLRIVLRRDGYEVTVAENGREAVERLGREPFDLVLSDIRMPDVGGVEVLRAARAASDETIVFMMTAYASAETAVEAMRLGAADYFMKPFSMDELRMKVRQHFEARRAKEENLLLRKALKSRHGFENVIGSSPPMQELFKTVETVATTNSTVLITGESGTGKEVIAHALHYSSLRRDHPFVAINCGALPEALLESELFGHVRGAFTGADSNKKGLIEAAGRGSIFLDEIGEMNTTMQVKLLRVLQERRFRRVGGTEESPADIRVIAATNQDLQKLVAEGRFREDLFYRLNVIPLHIPPLRARADDIPLLAEHFLNKFVGESGKSVRGIARDAMELLMAYAWPGNVRELENVIERAVALEQGPTVQAATLPEHLWAGAHGVSLTRVVEGPAPVSGLPDLHPGFDLEARSDDFYRHYLLLALERAGGVQVKAAELLGMSFRSFRYYAKKLNIR
ncbi:MAG: sigma-54-dependent transcriptional regulator [Vicinamibacterales bacterium]